MARPVGRNGCVMMDAEGIPCCSKTILSSTLPDEHDPQSPTPATTTSQLDLYSSMISVCGATPELCFLRMMCVFAPCSFSSIEAMRSSSWSELCLVLSTSPSRRPESDFGRGAYLIVRGVASVVGSKICIGMLRSFLITSSLHHYKRSKKTKTIEPPMNADN